MAKRKGRKSLKKILEEAVEEAELRPTTLSQQLFEELDGFFWRENEIVIWSPAMIDLPAKVYRTLATGLRHRGFQITRQKGVELRKNRLMSVNRYIIEGDGLGEEAAIYATLHGLTIVETF